MDKQIIYNCPHISLTDWGTYACKLYNPRDKNCIVSGGNCGSNISCPYKQLLRKEQECEELNNTITNLENIRDEFSTKLDQLKSENEELKKIIERLDVPKHEVIDMDIAFENEKLKDLNTRLDNQRETYWKGYQKLEKTLIEIKEIAQYDVYTPHTDLCIKLNWVKKKISEVENDKTL